MLLVVQLSIVQFSEAISRLLYSREVTTSAVPSPTQSSLLNFMTDDEKTLDDERLSVFSSLWYDAIRVVFREVVS